MPQLKPAAFTSVTIETSAASADDAAGILVARGALGCEIRQRPVPDSRSHARTARLLAYFPARSDVIVRKALDALRSAGMLLAGSPPVLDQLADPGWATMWQKRFEPLRVGRRILIVPPWNHNVATHRTIVIIQPGQAFGTGHHASTFGTLSLLTRICESRKIARALDVGTGSGILAIAMRKLGAQQITAIDQDAIALDNARENLELNHLDGAIRLSAAPLSSIRGRFDLITANILSSVLIGMAPLLMSRLRAGGHLVLAGILAREARSVADAYLPDLKLIRTRADGRWRALLFQR